MLGTILLVNISNAAVTLELNTTGPMARARMRSQRFYSILIPRGSKFDVCYKLDVDRETAKSICASSPQLKAFKARIKIIDTSEQPKLEEKPAPVEPTADLEPTDLESITESDSKHETHILDLIEEAKASPDDWVISKDNQLEKSEPEPEPEPDPEPEPEPDPEEKTEEKAELTDDTETESEESGFDSEESSESDQPLLQIGGKAKSMPDMPVDTALLDDLPDGEPTDMWERKYVLQYALAWGVDVGKFDSKKRLLAKIEKWKNER